ncbi:MAG: GNAT family N-acetyltransferase [Rhizobiales bacterium]|nr:GNAT family N-acetyltransferase [Hyphomicrobiales bacterium]
MYDLSKFDEKFGKYINIKLANTNDLGDIYNTQITAFPDDPANLSIDDFTNAIHDKKHTLFVATYKDEFAGYTALYQKTFSPWASGNNIIVVQKFTVKCIAPYLLRHAIKHCKRPFIRIYVEKNNKKAIQLYRKFGFFHVSTIAKHYENGDDALVMMIFTW